MVDWLIESLQYLWEWLIEKCKELADVAMNGFIHDLPIFDGTGMEGAADWLEVANQWLPLDLAVTLVAGEWVFIGLFIVAKIIFKAIPTVG